MRTTEQVRLSSKILVALAVLASLGCFSLFVGLIWGSRYRANSNQSIEYVRALLTQSPCLANVCPGMLGRNVVNDKLAQDSLVEWVNNLGPGRAMHYSLEGSHRGVIFFRQDENQNNEVVKEIVLDLPGATLGTVLGSLGEPDELFLMLGCGRGMHIQARLLYRDKGMQVFLQYAATWRERRSRVESIILDESTLVTGIHYFEPTRYDEWLGDIRNRIELSGYFDLSPFVTDETVVTAVQPWPGMNTPVQPLDLCPR